jgi:hypothetical protein
MPMNATRARQLLKEFNFRRLFVEELGWDKHQASLEVMLSDQARTLVAIAHKRGMVAYHCPTPAGEPMPEYALRRKVEQQVAKNTHEHFIIFTDEARATQIWQWVRREPGKPTACREHTYHTSQPGDALLQKLQTIAFSLDEEEAISLPDVTGRARAAFDVERVTKRFYDQFQKEHTAFLKFITGIPESGDHEWYASVMLNRLMFVYFMQRKGFLDGDRDYLRNRLARCRKEKGHDKFYSFYRYFLLRLFHEGLGGRRRDAETRKLIGRVPYLNGGIFDAHELERPDRYGKAIRIPDKAFERIFDYFDQYQWHLDERPLRADNEINPDVLGYIFEKYINQKQMGAYYTKEDITEYISKSTVLPFLFEAARSKCKVAFENPGGPTLWDLLRQTPDRYIYAPVRHGMDRQLPDNIAAGLESISKRTEWNRSAPPEFGLPTEMWREIVTRRRRCEELRRKLAAGDVRDIRDLLSLNLDIRQFAQDVIEHCEGPELLRAFWQTIEQVTILDPTCGSGAFLFSALNILEPLYEACLDRMEAFVTDLDRSGEKHRPEKFSDFRKVLDRVAAHTNRRYFVLKSIILRNLFGVDIMEEAVEICKLRMFLKLAGQVDPELGSHNLGIEPLPDIDFNIRSGNTLVGYSNYDDIKKAVASRLDFENAAEKIYAKAADLQQTFDAFRRYQTDGDSSVPTEHKLELRHRLKALEDELNLHLAAEYGLTVGDKVAHAKWVKSHQPFHWLVEFHRIMDGGGFDVIIGNPPYVESTKIKDYRVKNYETEKCGNVYTLCVERCSRLLSGLGYLGVIVPLSGFSTGRMEPYQALVSRRFGRLAISYYSGDAHPSVLFDGVKYRLCIIVATDGRRGTEVTDYLRWYADERPALFSAKIAYGKCDYQTGFLRFAKIGSPLARQALDKLLSHKNVLAAYVREGGKGHITYHRSPVFWIRSMDFEPYFRSPVKHRSTDHLKDLYFSDMTLARRVGAFLNSSTFYFWFSAQGNCRNIAGPDVENFPIGSIDDAELDELDNIFPRLMKDLRKHSKRRVYVYEASGKVEYDEFYPDKSKSIVDDIDRVLAQHYGFSDEELDFIINYDIKYRMGREIEEEG